MAQERIGKCHFLQQTVFRWQFWTSSIAGSTAIEAGQTIRFLEAAKYITSSNSKLCHASNDGMRWPKNASENAIFFSRQCSGGSFGPRLSLDPPPLKRGKR